MMLLLHIFSEFQEKVYYGYININLGTMFW